MVPTLKLIYDRCEEVGLCRLWTQGCNKHGVPILSLSAKDRARSVRRIAYRLIFGDIPPGQFVYVTCGNSRCLSGKCMRAGTKSEYMLAASARGAYTNPARNAQRARTARQRSHLTMDDVRKIRADRAAGALLREIAAEHGISMDVVSKIARNELWREHAANSGIFNGASVQIRINSAECADKPGPPQQFGRRDVLDAHWVLRDPMASPAMVAWARAALAEAA